jgi:hypothetical protein
VVTANSASLEPSVATSILVGKMLIGPRPPCSRCGYVRKYDASWGVPALPRKLYSPECVEKLSEKGFE